MEVRNIYIAVPAHAVMQSVADPQYCFNTVNEFLQVRGDSSLFNVKLVAALPEVHFSNSRFLLSPICSWKKPVLPILLLLPALLEICSKLYR